MNAPRMASKAAQGWGQRLIDPARPEQREPCPCCAVALRTLRRRATAWAEQLESPTSEDQRQSLKTASGEFTTDREQDHGWDRTGRRAALARQGIAATCAEPPQMMGSAWARPTMISSRRITAQRAALGRRDIGRHACQLRQGGPKTQRDALSVSEFGWSGDL